MKTQLKLKQLAMAMLAVLSLSSCLDSDDPSFQIAPTVALVYQETSRSGEEGDYMYMERFKPYFQIAANYEMLNCQGTGDGGIIMMSPMEGSYNLMYESTNSLSLTYPAGIYTFTAKHSEEETASCRATLAGDTIGYINVKKLEYANNEIVAQFDEAKNADVYLVAIGKSGNEVLPLYSKTFNQYPNNGEVKISITDEIKETYGLEENCVIYVGAYSLNSAGYVQVFAVNPDQKIPMR